MKKWILVLLIAISLASLINISLNKKTINPNINLPKTQNPNLSPKKQSVLIDIDRNPIHVSWVFVKPNKIELFSNLENKETSEKIKSDKNCKILINGGFYSKENTHLGLFISNYETISKSIQNNLLNGYLYVNSQNAIISSFSPPLNVRLALQSGPILTKNSNPLLLKINNDYPARRMTAGITNSKELIFLTFYRDKSLFEGPLLGDLPKTLDFFTKQTGIDIADAINLDGGSASSFLTEFESLPELSQIGSYFCGR